MLLAAPLLAALAAFGPGAGAGGADLAPSRWRSGEAVADLEVRLRLHRESRLEVDAPVRGPAVPPACVADVCQVRVEVPGFATKFGRPSRSELFATLLDRAGIEPFASIAWVFVATGLRVDWSPPVFDAGDPAAAHGGGWGTLSVRLRLRVNPMNQPVFPARGRSRAAQRSWTTLIAPRA